MENKQQVCLVDKYDTHDSEGNINLYVGGYRITMPDNIYEMLIRKYQKRHEKFKEIAKELEPFIMENPFLGAVAILGFTSKVLEQAHPLGE